MADIKLVIKMSEEVYNYIMRLNSCNMAEEYIKNGTPLPKGHGRLIDADMLDDVIMQMNENGSEITRYEYKVIDNVLFEMPTIIEADKESEEA